MSLIGSILEFVRMNLTLENVDCVAEAHVFVRKYFPKISQLKLTFKFKLIFKMFE